MRSRKRTTVTLEPDVARLLSEPARQTRKSFKETLNAAVRLSPGRVTDSTEDREFIIEARSMQLKAGGMEGISTLCWIDASAGSA